MAERTSDWIKRWDSSQWSSPEWRRYLIDFIEDGERAMEKLPELEQLCSKQEKYIEYLERHLELLQKTLDLAEKLITRPVLIPRDCEVIK